MKTLVFVLVFVGALFDAGVVSGQANQVRVGPNVHVSQADAAYPMGEVLLSADPVDPNRLLGCGIVYETSRQRRWTVVYLSTDRGRSWQRTLDTKSLREDSADPACALGRNGLAAHIAIGIGKTNPETKIPNYGLGVYRSSDGGKTWTQQEDMPMNFQGVDRESLTIDTVSQGKFAGRIYISGVSWTRALEGSAKNGFAVWRSRDGGMTFEGPLKRVTDPNHYLLGAGNSVVLSEGTVVSVFGELKNSDGRGVARNTEESNAVLRSITTTEGGDNLSETVKVDDFFMVWGEKNSSRTALGNPTIAVDSGNGPFRDRLYATWGDERDGRSAIRLAYSSDKGKSWSKSIVIDDVPVPAENQKGPENFLPTVAVNKDGVVAVTWYDRRENLDGLGWYLRARASLDGGDTWLPSVRVSEKPNTFAPAQKLLTYATATGPGGPDDKEKTANRTQLKVFLQVRQFFAGDYAGLAADASGTFHAWWIDNRTGVGQIWSAPIMVEGKAIRNGDATLAKLTDVSAEVDLEIVSSNYDRSSHTVSVGVRLKNLSKKTILGPVKLRLLNITSAIGSPSAGNADNKFTQPGAVWDISYLLKDNIVKPDETSEVKQLVFHVDQSREFLVEKKLHLGLVDFDIRVLAGGVEPEVKPVTKNPGSAN